MNDLEKRKLEDTFLKAKKILDKVSFIKYSHSEFNVSYDNPYIPKYEYHDGIYYLCSEEREQIKNNIVAKNDDDMVEYLVREKIFQYANAYEYDHRHYFEDHLRLRDTISEFCFSFIDEFDYDFKRDYDDESAIISDLCYFYTKKCKELEEEYKKKNMDLTEIDYILNISNVGNSKQSIKNIHGKIEEIKEKFPETKKYFESLDKYYNLLNVD